MSGRAKAKRDYMRACMDHNDELSVKADDAHIASERIMAAAHRLDTAERPTQSGIDAARLEIEQEFDNLVSYAIAILDHGQQNKQNAIWTLDRVQILLNARRQKP